MLLAVDIGNTNIVMGISSEGVWNDFWRIQTVAERTEDEYAATIEILMNKSAYSFSDIDLVVIGSVVPRLTIPFKNIFSRRTGCDPVIVDDTIDSGITLNSGHPGSVGADLIASAAAAYDRFEKTCLVVDFGTATTVMAVKNPGELVGGAICSGLKITTDALVERTARLPAIPLEPPPQAVGRNTVEAMQSGLVLGHLCMIEGLVTRMKQELGTAEVIATGGFAEKLAPFTECFDAIDPLLTLNGLRLIALRQA